MIGCILIIPTAAPAPAGEPKGPALPPQENLLPLWAAAT